MPPKKSKIKKNKKNKKNKKKFLPNPANIGIDLNDNTYWINSLGIGSDDVPDHLSVMGINNESYKKFNKLFKKKGKKLNEKDKNQIKVDMPRTGGGFFENNNKWKKKKNLILMNLEKLLHKYFERSENQTYMQGDNRFAFCCLMYCNNNLKESFILYFYLKEKFHKWCFQIMDFDKHSLQAQSAVSLFYSISYSIDKNTLNKWGAYNANGTGLSMHYLWKNLTSGPLDLILTSILHFQDFNTFKKIFIEISTSSIEEIYYYLATFFCETFKDIDFNDDNQYTINNKKYNYRTPKNDQKDSLDLLDKKQILLDTNIGSLKVNSFYKIKNLKIPFNNARKHMSTTIKNHGSISKYFIKILKKSKKYSKKQGGSPFFPANDDEEGDKIMKNEIIVDFTKKDTLFSKIKGKIKRKKGGGYKLSITKDGWINFKKKTRRKKRRKRKNKSVKKYY